MPSANLEYLISSTHWLDAITPPLGQHLDRLAQAAELLINKRNGGANNRSSASRGPKTPSSATVDHSGRRREVSLGHAQGTNSGRLTVVLDIDNEDIQGTLTLDDKDFGPTNYDINGKHHGGTIEMRGNPQKMNSMLAGVLGTLNVIGHIKSDNKIDGKWSTTIGTNGTFKLDLSSTSNFGR